MRQYLRLLRRSAPRRHRAAVRLAVKALKDERGGEVMEYAIVAGLVVVGAISVIACVGTKITARWTGVRDAM